MGEQTYSRWHVQRLPGRARPIVLTCVFGLVAGLAAAGFQHATNALYSATLVPLSHKPPTVFLLGSLAVIIATAGIVGFLLNSFAPEVSGSGIRNAK
jgi:H+/Cl- antiporter ClcA